MNSRQLMMDAIQGNENPTTPVWFMRQAGRLFEEYRNLREEYDFKELCQDAEMNAQVTCMPAERLNVDAAIIFSDILLPLEILDAGFELVPGEGPVMDRTVRSHEDVEQLKKPTGVEKLNYVFRAIEGSIERLPDDVPLIGFAGAPFTLATYLVEGGKSRDHIRTRRFMLNNPEAWDELMDRLVNLTIPYLRGQVEAGAEILQLFDSWIGQIGPDQYRKWILPHTRRIREAFPDTPFIHFGTGTAGLLSSIADCEPDVIGLDWRVELSDVRDRLGDEFCYQGNMDPALPLTDADTVRSEADRILQASNPDGHIFNLGHGVLPDTEPEVIKKLVTHVHEHSHDIG